MSNKTKEDSMSVGAIVFILGVVMIIAAIIIYSKSEDNAFSRLLQTQQGQQGDLNALTKWRTEEWAKEKLELQDQINELKASNERAVDEIVRFRGEVDVFRDQTADTREKQIQLREILSGKRPMVNLKQMGPIQVEILGPSKPRQPAAPGNGKVTPMPPAKDLKKKPLGKGVKAVMENTK